MPICNCCFLDKGEEDFHALEFGLRGFEPTSSLLIEEVCRDCLDLKDLIIMGPKNYRITNTSEYRKKVEANYIQNVLAADFSRDEIYSAKEMYNLYLDNNLTTTKDYKIFKKAHLKKIADKGFIKLLYIPYSLNNHEVYSYYSIKKDFDKYIQKLINGKYIKISNIEFSIDKINNLKNSGFLHGDGEYTYIYKNNITQQVPCKKCGEVKDFSEFRTMNVPNKPDHYECLKCTLDFQREKYSNLSPEEKQIKVQQTLQWQKENAERVKQFRREWVKLPKNRVKRNIRRRLQDFMKTKNNNFSKDIGCTRGELIHHLESQFVEGMSWDNYGSGENGDHVGSWHIDHIIPLAKFKGKYPNHYTNLQPMWGIENMRKGDKLCV